ncbi:copper-binding protein [Rhodoferax sp.]|uniref:copper-binding protein n=1 Tax=Rhodoferax sp. TaxID=50421 RepID=UPI0025D99E28|nr:copper-binding protein [Rhodoferax sp.]
MKTHTQTVAQLLAGAALSLSLPVMAQASADHSNMGMNHDKMGMASAPDMADGEVRKIDKETGKITLRHGEIKHLDMPPMTMVFVAKDKAMLDKVKTGDKVRFMTIHENGQMIVTELQPR